MEAIERALGKSPGFMMNRTVQALRKAWSECIDAERVDLTPEEFFVLVMLDAVDGLSQTEMAESLMRDRTTVTRLLDGIVKKGLARRDHPREDRRVVRTWLTPKGREVYAAASQATVRLRKRFFAGIEPREMESLLRTLERVRANCGPVGGAASVDAGGGKGGGNSGLPGDQTGSRAASGPAPGRRPATGRTSAATRSATARSVAAPR
ncbi:MAG: MarR family transcriptional regulator [Phycisphaerales bacterium]